MSRFDHFAIRARLCLGGGILGSCAGNLVDHPVGQWYGAAIGILLGVIFVLALDRP